MNPLVPMGMHVPMNPGGGAPNVGMQMGGSGPLMQQPSPQQMQQSMPQQPPQDKMDNISKVKTLMGSLRESIPVSIVLSCSFNLFMFTTVFCGWFLKLAKLVIY